MQVLPLIILQSLNAPKTFGEILALCIIAIVIIGLIFWVAWPSLKENNIFKKGRIYNYGKGEHAQIYLRARERDTLGFIFVANVAGIALASYLAIQLKLQGINYHITDIDRLPLRLFGLGLFCTFALFVYALFGEMEMDLIRNFKYSLKVWLTGVFLSPLILFVINMGKITNNKYLLYLYCKSAIIGSGVGFITFLVLIFGVHYITARPIKTPVKRKQIAYATQASVLISILIAFFIVRADVNWFFTWLTYAIIIGLATHFYRMNTTVYSEVIYLEAEVID